MLDHDYDEDDLFDPEHGGMVRTRSRKERGMRLSRRELQRIKRRGQWRSGEYRAPRGYSHRKLNKRPMRARTTPPPQPINLDPRHYLDDVW